MPTNGGHLAGKAGVIPTAEEIAAANKKYDEEVKAAADKKAAEERAGNTAASQGPSQGP